MTTDSVEVSTALVRRAVVGASGEEINTRVTKLLADDLQQRQEQDVIRVMRGRWREGVQAKLDQYTREAQEKNKVHRQAETAFDEACQQAAEEEAAETVAALVGLFKEFSPLPEITVQGSLTFAAVKRKGGPQKPMLHIVLTLSGKGHNYSPDTIEISRTVPLSPELKRLHKAVADAKAALDEVLAKQTRCQAELAALPSRVEALQDRLAERRVAAVQIDAMESLQKYVTGWLDQL